jgi:imidazolonepropionase-like amidohydrolase
MFLLSTQQRVVRIVIIAAFSAAIALVSPRNAASQAASPTVELRGGHWFDGQRFVSGSRFMRGGEFVARPATAADSVVQLGGQWMVPPFADAHTHSPDGTREFESIRDMYLRLGVFYVQTLANTRGGRAAIAAMVNIPSSVDVSFANAAVTSTGGHPQILYEALAVHYRPFANAGEGPALARSRLRDGDAYLRFDSLPQLPAIIAALQRDSIAIVKVMLIDSDTWATAHRDSTKVGFYGIAPDLLLPLVNAAHAIGRRVWAHIDTPTDFAIAMRAGVDAFAHIPGYGAAFESDSVALRAILADSIVALARVRHVVMTATLVIGGNAAANDTTKDRAQARRFRDVTVRNARALRAAGVTFLVGSDTYSNADVIRDDARITAETLGLSPLERLRMWAVDTPLAIFPSRRITQLRVGYEASALALSCNPLRTPSCVNNITLRLKQGSWLTVPPVAAQTK